MPCRSSRHLLGGLSRSFGPGGVAQHTVLDALPRRCHDADGGRRADIPTEIKQGVASPAGTGDAFTTTIPIEGREEWLAALEVAGEGTAS